LGNPGADAARGRLTLDFRSSLIDRTAGWIPFSRHSVSRRRATSLDGSFTAHFSVRLTSATATDELARSMNRRYRIVADTIAKPADNVSGVVVKDTPSHNALSGLCKLLEGIVGQYPFDRFRPALL
jgi:hypothetical protein